MKSRSIRATLLFCSNSLACNGCSGYYFARDCVVHTNNLNVWVNFFPKSVSCSRYTHELCLSSDSHDQEAMNQYAAGIEAWSKGRTLFRFGAVILPEIWRWNMELALYR